VSMGSSSSGVAKDTVLLQMVCTSSSDERAERMSKVERVPEPPKSAKGRPRGVLLEWALRGDARSLQ
jgi:hypothetical protein